MIVFEKWCKTTFFLFLISELFVDHADFRKFAAVLHSHFPPYCKYVIYPLEWV